MYCNIKAISNILFLGLGSAYKGLHFIIIHLAMYLYFINFYISGLYFTTFKRFFKCYKLSKQQNLSCSYSVAISALSQNTLQPVNQAAGSIC